MDDVELPTSQPNGNGDSPDRFSLEHAATPSEVSPDAAPGGVGETTDPDPSSSSTPSHPPPLRLRTSDSFLSLPKKKSTLFGASSNLVNSIVGAGIVGIPYAFKQSGLIAGLFLLGLVSFLTDRSLRVIINLATFHPKLKNRNVLTYENLAFYPFGIAGKAFILVNMFIMAYGAMVAYLIIIKDTIPTILGVPDENFKREITLIVFSLCIMVPLSMQRDMASLSLWSFISVMADVILTGFVAGFAPIHESVSAAGGFGTVLSENWIKPTLFIGLGVLSTAMACQHSSFIVSGSLENRTSRRWKVVTASSISFAAIACAVMGICGYLGFLDETQGNVLNNFDNGSVAANGARTLLAITMFFTYPMESFVARHVFVALIHKGDLDAAHHEGRDGGGILCLNRKNLWTLAIYVVALLPALFLDDLGPVLSITGSLGGSCIAYIAPGFLYLGVNGDAFLEICSKLVAAGGGDKTSNKDTTTDFAPTEGQIELPVAGDAEQRLPDNGNSQDLELPVAGEHRDIVATKSGFKPFWWYLLGFPLWSAIASRGSRGMKEKLSTPAAEEDDSTNADDDGVDVISPDAEYHPTRGGFCMAVFFIVFGIVGVVVGIASNIYVQFVGKAY